MDRVKIASELSGRGKVHTEKSFEYRSFEKGDGKDGSDQDCERVGEAGEVIKLCLER